MMIEIDCNDNLAKIVLPCARCRHAKIIESIDGGCRISCDYRVIKGNLEELVSFARVCPEYSQSLDCLSNFIKSVSSSCSN
ncbi:MAG: hypothetical protein ACTSYI_02190 [Promethearchaeota archaeon]